MQKNKKAKDMFNMDWNSSKYRTDDISYLSRLECVYFHFTRQIHLSGFEASKAMRMFFAPVEAISILICAGLRSIPSGLRAGKSLRKRCDTFPDVTGS